MLPPVRADHQVVHRRAQADPLVVAAAAQQHRPAAGQPADRGRDRGQRVPHGAGGLVVAVGRDHEDAVRARRAGAASAVPLPRTPRPTVSAAAAASVRASRRRGRGWVGVRNVHGCPHRAQIVVAHRQRQASDRLRVILLASDADGSEPVESAHSG